MNRTTRSWEAFGREDPLWAILTRPDARGGRWDVDAFFATGPGAVDRALAPLAAHRRGSSIRRVLELGCGVGRLTRALADRFEDVHGVDVARSMIERARGFDRAERCTFHVNPHPDLRLFADDTFDLVFSLLTLQHLPPRSALRYVAEFGRVLAPGGIALFQIPVAPRRGRVLGGRPLLRHVGTLATRARRALHVAWHHSLWRRPVMDMYGVPVAAVERTLRQGGCEVLAIEYDDSAGPDWHSRLYIARSVDRG